MPNALPCAIVPWPSVYSWFHALCVCGVLQATQKFLEIVNKARGRKGAGPITWKTAVKFLMARKFDVDRWGGAAWGVSGSLGDGVTGGFGWCREPNAKNYQTAWG